MFTVRLPYRYTYEKRVHRHYIGTPSIFQLNNYRSSVKMRSRLHHPTKPTSHKKRTYVHWLSHVRALLIARTCIKQRTYVLFYRLTIIFTDFPLLLLTISTPSGKDESEMLASPLAREALATIMPAAVCMLTDEADASFTTK